MIFIMHFYSPLFSERFAVPFDDRLPRVRGRLHADLHLLSAHPFPVDKALRRLCGRRDAKGVEKDNEEEQKQKRPNPID
jgi:hypothetical protein